MWCRPSAGNLLRPATNPTARSRSARAAPQRPSSAPQSTRPRRQGRDLPKRLPLEDARGIMTTFNRREFLETSAGVIAAGMILPLLTQSKKPLRLGLIIGIGNEPEAAIAKVHDLGLPTCQVYVEGFDPGLHTRLLQALDRLQIEATSVVVGGPGREVWEFYEGPLTAGVVPPETRAARERPLVKIPNLPPWATDRSEEHTSELQSPQYIVYRLVLHKKKET